MKSSILILFSTILLATVSLKSFSQGINLRAGYAYSPENGLILLPPIKLSAEYCFSSQPRTYYAGITMGGNMMMEFWGGIGLYGGYKINELFFENEYNWFVDLGDDYYGVPSRSQFSMNPKIGIEKYHMYVKAGPYIEFGKNSNRQINNYIHCGSVIINLEVGFHYFFDFNELLPY